MIPFFSRYFPFLPQAFLTFTECGFTFQVYNLFFCFTSLLNIWIFIKHEKIINVEVTKEDNVEFGHNVNDVKVGYEKENLSFADSNLAVTNF